MSGGMLALHRTAHPHCWAENGELVFKKILLPVDNSTTAGASIRYASQIASTANAELHLLHAGSESEFRRYQFDWPTDADVSPGTTRLVSSRLILPGSPAQTIVDYADHIGADLIMMPTRGYGTKARRSLTAPGGPQQPGVRISSSCTPSLQ